MKRFVNWLQVPTHFVGHCYVVENNMECWLNGIGAMHPHGYHRLDGPATIYSSGNKGFWINDCSFSEKDYWNHPLVIEAKLKTILNMID